MQFFQVDVFADGPYRGNPLAVFPEAAELSATQMQAIAREMNLSESSFVTNVDAGGYDVRIFTPAEELPFAGHPTIGTAWTLAHIGAIAGDATVQRSAAGETPLELRDGVWWLERSGGRAEPDRHETSPTFVADLARALGITEGDVGLDSRELGRSGRLMPAYANAGLDQLMVPVKNVDALGRCTPQSELLKEVAGMGAYPFTTDRPGFVRARGFWPGVGVIEDPATGSAACALGIYLADRTGDIELELTQGVEMGRTSVMKVRAAADRVSVGGECALILEGALQALP